MIENKEKKRCPLCNYVLNKRHEGLVCKNFRCKLYFKLGKGWVLLEKDKEEKYKFIFKYVFDRKRCNKDWLKFKSEILIRDNFHCKICEYDLKELYTERGNLEIHHILPHSTHPWLFFDPNNVITLCENCHKKIHSKDKYKFS